MSFRALGEASVSSCVGFCMLITVLLTVSSILINRQNMYAVPCLRRGKMWGKAKEKTPLRVCKSVFSEVVIVGS